MALFDMFRKNKEKLLPAFQQAIERVDELNIPEVYKPVFVNVMKNMSKMFCDIPEITLNVQELFDKFLYGEKGLRIEEKTYEEIAKDMKKSANGYFNQEENLIVVPEVLNNPNETLDSLEHTFAHEFVHFMINNAGLEPSSPALNEMMTETTARFLCDGKGGGAYGYLMAFKKDCEELLSPNHDVKVDIAKFFNRNLKSIEWMNLLGDKILPLADYNKLLGYEARSVANILVYKKSKQLGVDKKISSEQLSELLKIKNFEFFMDEKYIDAAIINNLFSFVNKNEANTELLIMSRLKAFELLKQNEIPDIARGMIKDIEDLGTLQRFTIDGQFYAIYKRNNKFRYIKAGMNEHGHSQSTLYYECPREIRNIIEYNEITGKFQSLKSEVKIFSGLIDEEELQKINNLMNMDYSRKYETSKNNKKREAEKATVYDSKQSYLRLFAVLPNEEIIEIDKTADCKDGLDCDKIMFKVKSKVKVGDEFFVVSARNSWDIRCGQSILGFKVFDKDYGVKFDPVGDVRNVILHYSDGTPQDDYRRMKEYIKVDQKYFANETNVKKDLKIAKSCGQEL